LSVRVLSASARLMEYQNFFMRKYHWMVKARIMKVKVKPPIENYFRYVVSSPKPIIYDNLPISSSMIR
jgi:hypothetical protein